MIEHVMQAIMAISDRILVMDYGAVDCRRPYPKKWLTILR